MHVGMKLAVCNTLRDEVIGQDVIRFYAVYKKKDYVSTCVIDFVTMDATIPRNTVYKIYAKVW
jgi:hypothetical protein